MLVSWHETENRGVGALDNCFHQVLSSHWFRGDTCDQMLGSDWRRFHFLTWNWKRWKGDGMRSDKIWSRNFPGYYHCKIGNYSNYWKSNKWFYFLTWNLNLGVGGGLGIWGRAHEIFLYKLPKETKRNFSPFFFPQMKNGIIEVNFSQFLLKMG